VTGWSGRARTTFSLLVLIQIKLENPSAVFVAVALPFDRLLSDVGSSENRWSSHSLYLQALGALLGPTAAMAWCPRPICSRVIIDLHFGPRTAWKISRGNPRAALSCWTIRENGLLDLPLLG